MPIRYVFLSSSCALLLLKVTAAACASRVVMCPQQQVPSGSYSLCTMHCVRLMPPGAQVLRFRSGAAASVQVCQWPSVPSKQLPLPLPAWESLGGLKDPVGVGVALRGSDGHGGSGYEQLLLNLGSPYESSQAGLSSCLVSLHLLTLTANCCQTLTAGCMLHTKALSCTQKLYNRQASCAATGCRVV